MDGRPVPKGKVTLVIDADPFHIFHDGCITKTCDFSFGMLKMQPFLLRSPACLFIVYFVEGEETEEPAADMCEVYPDPVTQGLNGYIYKQSEEGKANLVKFDVINSDEVSHLHIKT